MIKNLLYALILSLSLTAMAGTSNTQVVEGVITKIEADKVTITSHGKDIIIKKKFVPKNQLKVGTSVSIVAETKDKK